MSRRQKIILFIGGLAMVVLAVFGIFTVATLINKNKGTNNGVNNGSSPSSDQVSNSSLSGSAFAPRNSDLPSAPALSSVMTSTPVAGSVSAAPTFNGSPVKSLSDVAQIITASSSNTPSGSAPASQSLLAMPVIPDSDIAIDSSGIVTVSDYIKYFDTHYADISFNNARFTTTLKDSNGIILFAPQLVARALASGDFSEIHASLLVDRDYAAAKIKFLKSIKVTGDAISLDKETIGFEELTVDLINNALATESGTFSKNNLAQFYEQFTATAQEANNNLIKESDALSLKQKKSTNFFAWIMQALGLNHPALAQTPANMPFGGKIGLPLFCGCTAGYWIFVGPPSPASIFVPIAFVSSPLFFSYKSLVPGTWWLGLYINSGAPIPCAEPPVCTPVGAGYPVYMAGTSIPS